jgi:hypothetical protein
MGYIMKPPKHIVRLGKEAVSLWKLQQALGKQNNERKFLERRAVR